MLKKYKTILTQAEAEIVEKKSRFIATVRPVKTEEEAKAFIEEMKKKYWMEFVRKKVVKRLLLWHIVSQPCILLIVFWYLIMENWYRQKKSKLSVPYRFRTVYRYRKNDQYWKRPDRSVWLLHQDQSRDAPEH